MLNNYLLRCEFFIDLLSLHAIVSTIMQEDDPNVLDVFSSLIHTVMEVNKLSSKLLKQWGTYCTTQSKLSDDSYQ